MNIFAFEFGFRVLDCVDGCLGRRAGVFSNASAVNAVKSALD